MQGLVLRWKYAVRMDCRGYQQRRTESADNGAWLRAGALCDIGGVTIMPPGCAPLSRGELCGG